MKPQPTENLGDSAGHQTPLLGLPLASSSLLISQIPSHGGVPRRTFNSEEARNHKPRALPQSRLGSTALLSPGSQAAGVGSTENPVP